MTSQNIPENTAVQPLARLRQRLRQARAAMPQAQRDRGGLLMRARLYTWLNVVRSDAEHNGRPFPGTVAAFWPLPDEPDLRPLLEQWAEADVTIALPVVRERNAPLAFLPWTPDAPLRQGHYGIQEPAGGPDLVPDVILVPTLGYTRQADRLGYGAGYYDRTLAALRTQGHNFIAIGVAWSDCKLDATYQPAPHDMRLDAIITQDGWVPQAPLATPGTAGGTTLHTYTLR